MEYTVIKDLIERVTLKQFKAGEKYVCLDSDRAAFLIRTGYLAPPEEGSEEEQETEAEKPKKEVKPQKGNNKRTTKSKKA